jgi:hypothetical protein
MTKEKIKIKVPQPKVRKDWGNVKPYTRVHGSTGYDRDEEKEEIEEAVEEAIEEIDEIDQTEEIASEKKPAGKARRK